VHAAAVRYAQRGWRVLPLHTVREDGCACGFSCHSPGKHPRTTNGLTDATTDPAAIDLWWGRAPDANVGIATGVASNLVVLDIDPRHDGDESLRALEREHGILPDSIEAITGGGGRHLFFSHPGGHVPSRVGLRSGIDIRADGAYVVAAPSQHGSGAQYRWALSSGPDDVPLAELPAWLLELIADRGDSTEAASEESDVIADGQRNQTLTRFAGAMRAVAMRETEIEVALLEANQRCAPPLAESEVRAIAESVSRYRPQAQGGSIADRYGLLAYVSWVPLWSVWLRLPGVTPAEFKVLIALLAHYRQADEHVSLSQETIAREVGVGRRTANKQLLGLRRKGFVAVRPDPQYGRRADAPVRKATLYYCLEPAIALMTLWAAHEAGPSELRQALWQAGIERLLGFASSVTQNEWSWRAGALSTDCGDAAADIAAEVVLAYAPGSAEGSR
jgi:hypothetical protein